MDKSVVSAVVETHGCLILGVTMGHVRLGPLPRSRKWRNVILLLGDGARASEIAAATQDAMGATLKQAANLPDFKEAMWLLTSLPLAARGPNFLEDAREMGLNLTTEPTLLELSNAIGEALDIRRGEVGGSDFGEMAQLALVESLVDAIEPQLPTLFSPDPAEVRTAIGRLSSGGQFSGLARDFFSRLIHRSLDFHLSRELANHVGAGRRFPTDVERRAFDDALARHCWEAARIVETYSSGWYGKTVWREGRLTREATDGFARYAFTKLHSELARRHVEV